MAKHSGDKAKHRAKKKACHCQAQNPEACTCGDHCNCSAACTCCGSAAKGKAHR